MEYANLFAVRLDDIQNIRIRAALDRLKASFAKQNGIIQRVMQELKQHFLK